MGLLLVFLQIHLLAALRAVVVERRSKIDPGQYERQAKANGNDENGVDKAVLRYNEGDQAEIFVSSQEYTLVAHLYACNASRKKKTIVHW